MRGSRTRAILIAAVVACFACGGGCEESPSSTATSQDQAAPTSQPAAAVATDTPMMVDLRAKAEKGDAAAMTNLARAYEWRGTSQDRAQARQWYEKAAAAGDQGARESLRMLDATAGSSGAGGAPATSQPTATGATDTSAGAGGTLLTPSDLGDSLSGGVSFPTSAPAADAGAAAPAATAPTALRTTPTDPAKVSWDDVIHSFDTTGVVTGEQKTRDGQFVGVATAKDRTLVLGAMGPTADNLQHVRGVIRIRNKQDPNSSPRVGQMTAMADMITRGNVGRTEMGEWVATYLRTQQKSEPIFRNGWRIQITGPAGDGVRDRFDYIGAAVVVELKK